MGAGSLLQKVLTERNRQDQKWGGPLHDDRHTAADWKQYLFDHATRALTATPGSPDAIQELVKVVALGFAVAEALQREKDTWRLDQRMLEAANWGTYTFPEVSAAFVAQRIADEGQELANQPDDSLEAADVLILVAIWAAKQGVDLEEAVNSKMRINEERLWNHETMKHIKADA